MKQTWKSLPTETALMLVGVILTTGLSWLLHLSGFDGAPVTLVLLTAVILSSWAFGVVQSVLSSLLVVSIISFLYSRPLYSFGVEDERTYITFGLVISIGLVVAITTAQRREALRVLQLRHTRLEVLYDLAACVTLAATEQQLCLTAQLNLSLAIGSPVQIIEPQSIDSETGLEVPLPRATGSPLSLKIDKADAPLLQGKEAARWLETVAQTLGQALDRTAWRQLGEEKKAALEVAHIQNTFLQSVSHDLRTPLTVIAATAAALLERVTPQEYLWKNLEALTVESEQLVGQVDKILDLTRVSSSTHSIRQEWVPSDDIATSISDLWRGRDRSALSVKQENLGSTLIYLDEVLVLKAVGNLLENAAKYAPGNLDVTILEANGFVEFSVGDRGPGIPALLHSKIFERFFRGESADSKHRYRGTGIGLALVKAVALAHQGDAGVRDRIGGGAVFWFTIKQPDTQPSLWGK